MSPTRCTCVLYEQMLRGLLVWDLGFLARFGLGVQYAGLDEGEEVHWVLARGLKGAHDKQHSMVPNGTSLSTIQMRTMLGLSKY